ncbi:MAG: RodZ domain-containing protein [Rudaea sp.]
MNINPTNIDEIESDDTSVSETATEAAHRVESNESCEDAICLGLRLRESRVARGWSVEDVAHQLKLPHTVIEALEAEHFDRIGHGIFLRGYLAKYLQLLDLPQTLASSVLDDHDDLPPLVTSGAISRPRYLFDRYSGSALYLILTGVFVVPAVLLAMHAGLDAGIARIAPLDAPVPGVPATSAQGDVVTHEVTSSAKATSTTRHEPAHDATDVPAVMASMATFTAGKQKPAEAPALVLPAPTKVAEAPVADDGSHSLHLQLVEPSWVEVEDGSGKQLEYALLPAGAVRDYHSKQSLSVLLGNASGVSIRVDGKPRDLAPYLRGNVARFKLADGDWTTSPSGG